MQVSSRTNMYRVSFNLGRGLRVTARRICLRGAPSFGITINKTKEQFSNASRISRTIWRRYRTSSAAIREPDGLDWAGWVEVKRTGGTRNLVGMVERPLPRNGGMARLLVCPLCNELRRAL